MASSTTAALSHYHAVVLKYNPGSGLWSERSGKTCNTMEEAVDYLIRTQIQNYYRHCNKYPNREEREQRFRIDIQLIRESLLRSEQLCFPAQGIYREHMLCRASNLDTPHPAIYADVVATNYKDIIAGSST